jgi:hypothetical protein
MIGALPAHLCEVGADRQAIEKCRGVMRRGRGRIVSSSSIASLIRMLSFLSCIASSWYLDRRSRHSHLVKRVGILGLGRRCEEDVAVEVIVEGLVGGIGKYARHIGGPSADSLSVIDIFEGPGTLRLGHGGLLCLSGPRNVV